MANEKHKLPYEDFPLWPHPNGQWAKKIRGRVFYFGLWDDWNAALNKYLDQKDDLQLGRKPRAKSEKEGVTVKYLLDHFHEHKKQAMEQGDISERTFAEYFDICTRIRDQFGRDRLVDDLDIDDFTELREALSKGLQGGKVAPVRLANLVTRARSVFKYAFEQRLIDRPMAFGPGFKMPSKKTIRIARSKRPARMFKAEELRPIIDGANPVMKAMVLLGINCGFGNTDCATVQIENIHFDSKQVIFPRPKTGEKRKCPLWLETIDAIKAAMKVRPLPKNPEHENLLFITRWGAQYVRTSSTGKAIDGVYAEFATLLKKLKLYRENLGFYAIRHTFETIGGGKGDQIAVNAIMGHVDSTMSAAYREAIEDNRLVAVTDHIHAWLWPAEPKRQPAKKKQPGKSIGRK